MHARELVELAGLVTVHGQTLIRDGQRLWDERLELYWTASKSRLDRWCRTLYKSRHPSPGAHVSRRQLRTTIQEVLTAEVLTRVWTALLSAYDRQRHASEAEPIARSVFIGQLEVRQRALQALLETTDLPVEDCLDLDRLRRLCERWTDILIGYLSSAHGFGSCSTGGDDLFEYATSTERARGYAHEFRRSLSGFNQTKAWSVLVLPLRLGFSQVLGDDSPNVDLNGQIAQSIIGCFPPSMFDSTGWARSLWLTQLMQGANDTQVLIEDLFAAEPRNPNEVHQALRRVELELRRRRGFEV